MLAFLHLPASSTAPGHPDLILVGGVPGAGKSTAIRRVAADRPEVVAADPDGLRAVLANLLPGVSYRTYRPLVHVGHHLRVLGLLWRGPQTGRPLVVHDPATRPRRRRLFAALARARGWTPALVYVDVERQAARRGQFSRGRVVDPSSFARHWARWVALRGQLTSSAGPADADDWIAILVVDRSSATAALSALCQGAVAETAEVRQPA